MRTIDPLWSAVCVGPSSSTSSAGDVDFEGSRENVFQHPIRYPGIQYNRTCSMRFVRRAVPDCRAPDLECRFVGCSLVALFNPASPSHQTLGPCSRKAAAVSRPSAKLFGFCRAGWCRVLNEHHERQGQRIVDDDEQTGSL
eukprot:2731537-Rhodomonas_salina.1